MNIPSTPAFCIIAPTAYLDQYATQSNRHLVLAHLVDRDQVYADFYKRMRARGDYIIMDNSAFELLTPYSPDKLVSLAERCGAHAVVLPDYPFQPASKTIDAAREFIPKFKQAGLHTFFVPQSEVGQLEDWIFSYKWAAQNPDIDIIGMSILGIPNALPHIPPAYARVVMTQLLIDRCVFNKRKYHHFLGLNAGPALEIPPLLRMEALSSCDSSNPVWMGILGHEYSYNTDSYLPVKKAKMEVDFDFHWIKDQNTHHRIQTNVGMALNLFNDSTN